MWSPELLGYDFGPGHPMAPARLDLTMGLVRALGLLDDDADLRVVRPEPAPDDVLELVHEPAYVAAVRAASEHGTPDPARGLGTEDDPVFRGMHEAAARIVAGSYEAAGEIAAGRTRHAVNVAGGMHHAKAGAASGFCVYNDAAVAIRRLLDDGVERVAYVDLDAHHGDGVEEAFWGDPRVLTVSVHQSGATLFPGTGHPTDLGGPAPRGRRSTSRSRAAPTAPAGCARSTPSCRPCCARSAPRCSSPSTGATRTARTRCPTSTCPSTRSARPRPGCTGSRTS